MPRLPYTGVLGCADSVAWGRITAGEPVSSRLAGTVDVDEWLVPSSGGRTLAFEADGWAREVALRRGSRAAGFPW